MYRSIVFETSRSNTGIIFIRACIIRRIRLMCIKEKEKEKRKAKKKTSKF